jgi:metal-sulfur cluster biosynthetic enzyme
MMTDQAETALRRRFPDTASIRVHLQWDPPWSPELMSDEGRRSLGWAGDVGQTAGSGWKH